MTGQEIAELPLKQVYAASQDRKSFDETQLRELASSIEQHGLAQPITVRPDGAGRFVIVAGERRFRAHELLGVRTIKAIVRADLDDGGHADVQLIENVNRADLDPIEEARAYKARMAQFDLDEQGVADRYGRPVTLVRKRLELLNLDDEYVALVRSGDLSVAHAGTMSRLDGNRQRLAFAALRQGNGMTLYQFVTLCDRLWKEQQQDDLFDPDDFLKVQELVAESKKSSAVTGRDLVRATVDAGDALVRVLQALGVDLDDCEHLGIDGEAVRRTLDKIEQVRQTRQTALKNGPSGSKAKARKK